MLLARSTLVVAVLLWSLAATADEIAQFEGKVAQEFRIYLKKAGFKAFAVNGSGAFGYGYDAPSQDAADYLAAKSCNTSRKQQRLKANGVADCEIVHRAARD